MILVFILLGIIIFLLSISIILLLSTIQIEIKNLKIGNIENVNKSNIKDIYEIKIILYFLEKIPVFGFRLDSKKMKKISNSKQLEKIKLTQLKNISNDNKVLEKQMLAIIKNIRIKNLNLRIDLGLEDAILTSYLIAFLSSVIGIIIPHITNKKQIKDVMYIVNPIYENENKYHISLNSIIYLKIVHIINSMSKIKKGRDKNERTSNRRAYAYSYE